MAEEVGFDEEFTIKDLETLKVIADPLRIQILKTLRRPRTVKSIADELDMPATKLYYHVNQMEKHGLIRVVETNIVSGIIEKQYQATARNYRVDEGLLTDKSRFTGENLEALIMAILDDTKDEIRKSIKEGLIQLGDKKQLERGQFMRGNLYLMEEEAAEFASQLETLSNQYATLSQNNRESQDRLAFGYTIVFYPAAQPDDV